MNQCHYAWQMSGVWHRCQHPKGVNHGDRHEDGRSWVAVRYELDYHPHRFVA